MQSKSHYPPDKKLSEFQNAQATRQILIPQVSQFAKQSLNQSTYPNSLVVSAVMPVQGK